ncbi:stress response NST1-like isoform X1 [Labeo rohita]|uniref:Stress response NST1-like isoform X1 n=1 Tax=Labeo rohita TaxID=84645 RepID=A0A498LHX2_LABRO|nr:stress response NST1-like isoform X1 [Labeo rohita]
MSQQCAAQELAPVENLPEAPLTKAGESKAFDFNAMYRKCRKRHRQVKKEREKNEGGSHNDKAEKDTLSLEKIKERGHVAQKRRESAKFREMQSLENLMEGETTCFKPLPPVTKPATRPQKPAPAPEEVTLSGTPLQVDPPSVPEHFALSAARFKALLPVTKPATRPQKPAPACEEVTLPGTPLQMDPPSVPEHFALPAAHFKALLPVTKPATHPQKPAPAPEEVTMPGTPVQVSPPKQLSIPPSPTPAPDEAVALQLSSTKVCPSSLVKPQPSTSSLFEPPPQLMLIDIEDEENEYVEYTGKTLQACDLLKSERPRILETEINPRMPAWLESDSEVLEEVWASEVVEVLGFGEQKDDPDEMGDSKTTEGHLNEASQKKEMDEHMKKLFCVASPEGPKNETLHHVNVQEETKSKRKVPLFLFTWAEEKAKKKEEKKIRKEKEQRDKELLFERYRNDPKLKHLLINKHNHHYRSTE